MQSSGRSRDTHLPLMVFGIISILSKLVKSKPVLHESEKFSAELCFQVKLHAFLLWASIGILMPVGILIIRISSRIQCGKKAKIIFYAHLVVQISAVLLSIAAAVLSIKKFDNSFKNTHQRMGLGIYALILAQPLLGFLRPNRGSKLRSIWYTLHWLLGITISIIGTINIYLGLHGYEKMTSTNTKIWTIFFTFQVVMIAFIYLLQERWNYVKKQGVIVRDDQISPSDIRIITSTLGNQKGLPSVL